MGPVDGQASSKAGHGGAGRRLCGGGGSKRSKCSVNNVNNRSSIDVSSLFC